MEDQVESNRPRPKLWTIGGVLAVLTMGAGAAWGRFEAGRYTYAVLFGLLSPVISLWEWWRLRGGSDGDIVQQKAADGMLVLVMFAIFGLALVVLGD